MYYSASQVWTLLYIVFTKAQKGGNYAAQAREKTTVKINKAYFKTQAKAGNRSLGLPPPVLKFYI